MKIVILAGGTGSIALQTGLHGLLDSRIDGIDTKVIVNAYDNGLSTGAVRRVLGGKILGPSDVRKNQTTRLKLENPNSPWLKFLDIRFTSEAQNAEQFCVDHVDELVETLGKRRADFDCGMLYNAISTYFKIPAATQIDYNDFSLANIIYAGLARIHGNSLRGAAKTMAHLMGIKDNVLLNDDTSLFLGAKTQSGISVVDEGDIVSWGKLDDPFVDVFFTDEKGDTGWPVLCEESRQAIVKADLIILSSGTQWSSLIPTYATLGFQQAIEESAAKILLVMNRQPDKDSPGQTASDIVRLLSIPEYFGEKRLHVLLDSTGHPQMSVLDENARELVASVDVSELGPSTDGKPTTHMPSYLARAIGRVYFSEYLGSSHYMFDYDDTLVARGSKLTRTSNYNRSTLVSILNRRPSLISICTGNSIKAISIKDPHSAIMGVSTAMTVFADGGVNQYNYKLVSDDADEDAAQTHTLVGCVDPSAALDKVGPHSAVGIISALKSHGIPLSKIENRGNVVVSIKPIDPEYRPMTLSLVNLLLQYDSNVVARSAGRTTIDISRVNTSKAAAVQHVLAGSTGSVTFVGDEFAYGGNDSPVLELNDPRVKCLQVTGPAMTGFFLSVLLHEPRETTQVGQ